MLLEPRTSSEAMIALQSGIPAILDYEFCKFDETYDRGQTVQYGPL